MAALLGCAMASCAHDEAPTVAQSTTVTICLPADASPRMEYGAGRVAAALRSVGKQAPIVHTDSPTHGGAIHLAVDKVNGLKPEGFELKSEGDVLAVRGADDSGVLYGCLELASRIVQAKGIPAKLEFRDAPSMIMRGPCVGMQKTYILPGHKVYEYPYTPQNFPWFYDKARWITYLDFLANERMNVLYIWNGHPFASLVRVPDYPYAVEVPDDVLARNQEMFKFIVDEADKRGILVMQMFYNIIVSKPFAEHNHLKSTQFSSPTPLLADYTRKSIAEFVKTYPHAGLMVCLGEALRTDHTKWMVDTIIGGIHDGMKQAGITQDIPLMLRTHAMPAEEVIPQVIRHYPKLYTESKFNGESLTTWQPRGRWRQQHLLMSKLGAIHSVNIHILANLEPFRYGAQRFIKLCVQAAEDRENAKGIHLYPLCYWNWPYSPDKIDPPLEQINRDWIWFDAWARYAWNPRIDEKTDHRYWVGRLADMYGNPQAAEQILAAYNDSGECAPRILRRFGITEGNRQTMSLGMTLDELVRPEKYGAFSGLWEWQSPPGERLQEYVAREWNKQPHVGETPPQIIKEVLAFSRKAVEEADAAEPLVTKNKAEFERVRNDVHCIRAMSENYAEKAEAAMCVLRYGYSKNSADMEQAEKHLAASLEYYRQLVSLTKDTYNFANSMQTSQRKIPVVGGVDGHPANYHWSQLLPVYEKELADFHERVADIKSGKGDHVAITPLPKASIRVLTPGAETYEVRPDAKPFTDRDVVLKDVAPELRGQTGIRLPAGKMAAGEGTLEIEAPEKEKLLVGYFRSEKPEYLQVAKGETDAAAADLIEQSPSIQHAAVIDGMPGVDIHVVNIRKGRQVVDMHGKGVFVILGVVSSKTEVPERDAHLGQGKQ
ncbi:MAG: alpha-d-galacturonidase [Phycisphaerae bacterium]